MDFDPYKQWLQIEDASQPNHYELLGLPIFTEDPEVIRQAYADRYEAVRPYQTGRFEAAAQKVIDELSVALRCLTDAASKHEYDRELRDDLSARETVIASAESQETVVAPIVSLESSDEYQGGIGTPIPPALKDFTPPPPPLPPVAGPLAGPLAGPVDRPVAMPTGFIVLVAAGLFGVVGLFAIGLSLLVWTIARQDDSAVMTTGRQADTGANTPSAFDGNEPQVRPARSPVRKAAVAAPRVVERTGELSKMLVTSDGLAPERLHLLINDGSETFEAATDEEELIARALDCVAASENKALASQLRLRGRPSRAPRGFFDPTTGAATLALESIEVLASSSSPPPTLTNDERKTLRSLRTVGSFARFTATIQRLFTDGSGKMIVSLADREYCVELPPAWRTQWSEFAIGEACSFVTETSAEFATTHSPEGPAEVLSLKAETVGQPNFADITDNPASFRDRLFRYQANVRSFFTEGQRGTANLTLRHGGLVYGVQASADMTSQQQDFVDQLNWRQPVLVEFKIVGQRRPPEFELVSITHLNAPTTRVVMGNAVPMEVPNSRSSTPPASVAQRPPATITEALAIGSFFRDVPEAIDLPMFSAAPTALLTFRRPAREALLIEVDSSLCDLQAGSRIVAQAVANSPARWLLSWRRKSAVGGKDTVLAQLAWQDKQLLFEWIATPTAGTAGQLRNCFLTLQTENETYVVALRQPLINTNNRMPAEAADYRIPLELTDLPEADNLRLDVAVRYAGTEAVSQQGTTAARGQKLDIPLAGIGDGKVEIEAVLALLRDGKLALQAEPRYRTTPTTTIQLNRSEIQSELRRLKVNIAKAQNNLRRARDQRARNIIEETLVQTQESLITLTALGEDINGRLANLIRIHYRVSAQDGSRKLVLVDGGFRQPGTR